MGSTAAAAAPPIDDRTDEEILADLQTYRPVDPASSERNVWAFWDRGLAAAKPWCRRNVVGWVRRHHGRGWTVRVLDMVPGSPNHFSRFVPATPELLPAALLEPEGGVSGTAHAGPHAADLLRLPLLFLHGGVWLDVGFMLFRDLDSLCWDALAGEDNPLELAGFRMTVDEGIAMFWNGFIAARKGCVAVRLWHELFLRLWEGRASTEGMAKHPLLCHLPRYEVPSSTGQPPAFQYTAYVDYLIQMFCLERLRHTRDPALGWDGPDWFARGALLFECATEVYWAQVLTHWDGRKQFDMLSRRRRNEGTAGVDPEDEGYKEARTFVDGILATSSTMKISHGIVTEQREYLARIWDEPEHADADRAPGTFAEYLRWASVHYHQKKELVPLLLPVREDALLSGGLFDEVGKPHPHWDSENRS
ncbi:hypothetical protein DL764_006062 [Monosporascus ibericus]|uniref:Capsule polysaccharide biosynthesis protein n=1 Tax=Monosporascus ibericus TaxID=155417 RepID=A0A4Q4T605_9PEZI|nr:hypothetical protein DL764_006062 [Monosporascus ibericus]